MGGPDARISQRHPGLADDGFVEQPTEDLMKRARQPQGEGSLWQPSVLRGAGLRGCRQREGKEVPPCDHYSDSLKQFFSCDTNSKNWRPR